MTLTFDLLPNQSRILLTKASSLFINIQLSMAFVPEPGAGMGETNRQLQRHIQCESKKVAPPQNFLQYFHLG